MWKGKLINGKLINYVNEATVNYITKYVNKIDADHKNYIPKILTTKGIGKNYITNPNAKTNKFKEKQTRETYITRSGHKLSLPIYYRNKIYSEQERELLWIQKLDKQVRYIRGEKIDVSRSTSNYEHLLRWHQAQNKELGYGGDEKWTEIQYENQQRDMMRSKRIMDAARIGLPTHKT